MKIKLFTSETLDGVGCAVLAILAFSNKNDEVSIEYSHEGNINTKLKSFINSKKHLEYDKVYITDIDISSETAELIDNEHSYVYRNGELTQKSRIFSLVNSNFDDQRLYSNYEWASVDEKTYWFSDTYSKTHSQEEEYVCSTFLFSLEQGILDALVMPIYNDKAYNNYPFFKVLVEFMDMIRKHKMGHKMEIRSSERRECDQWFHLFRVSGTSSFVARMVRELPKLKFEISNDELSQMYSSD